jgi:hypothetical protein
MPFFTGRTGSLVYNAKPVAKIRDWSLETTVELLSTNAIDSTVNTYTPGVKGATGSATLIYYRLGTGESTTYTEFQALLSKVMKTGAITDSDVVALELNVGGDSKDDIKINAFITSASVASSTGELSVVPIQFTMTGDFTEVIVA